MKISLQWLNDYVDVTDYFSKPEELARLLTNAGLEVEGVEDLSKPYQHVVLGQVVKLDRHPNADKLTLCQVDVGDGKLRQIVCGAKNHKQGDKVVVALPGAVLPGDFAIKVSKIRDVESQGMMCSETELGIAEESAGIMILPADVKVGQPFAEYYGLNDVVIEINVTPNRADCLSHFGLAREISCLLNRELKEPSIEIKKTSESVKKWIDVKLKSPELCPRYSGRGMKGVKIAPSPAWLSRRLQTVGLSSINNVVDVTNYVMMELGQPLHAFDLDELKGAQLTIENAKREKFKSFDGSEYELTGEELTIRDGERAVALAGVVGSVNSGVTDKTVNLFIESAHFNPRTVRRTSRRLGIDTDSGYRFSRGTDPEGVVMALNRACALIQQLAGGTVTDDYYDIYPNPLKREAVEVRHHILEERLGYAVDMKDFAQWMKRLHCKVTLNGETALVEPPTFRWDLEIEMDFVEEYARLNGYDKIPETFPPLMAPPTKSSPLFVNANRVGEELKNQGFEEAIHYAFVKGEWQRSLINANQWKALGLDVGGEEVPVMNPLSEETGVMRQSLLPELLTNLIHNFHRGNTLGRVFEVGAVFGKRGEGARVDDKDVDGKNSKDKGVKGEAKRSAAVDLVPSVGPYVENQRIALSAWGQAKSLWQKGDYPPVYDIKGAIEGMLDAFQATGYQWRSVAPEQVPSFIHPGQVALLFYQGRNIGFIGSLHPAFRDEHKIRVEAAVGELDLTLLMAGQPRVPKYKPISKFQAVERDLSLLVDDKYQAQDLVKEIQKAGGELLRSVSIFDVYRGSNVPEGHAAIAFRMVFQDLSSTLSDDQISTLVKGIVTALEKKFGVKVR